MSEVEVQREMISDGLPVGVGSMRAGGELDLGMGTIETNIKPCEEGVYV